jgi:hypothetical protein
MRYERKEMEIDERKLEEVVSGAVKSALANHTQEFWVAPEQHYKDHLMIQNCAAQQEEMRLNHEFVSSVRDYAESGKKKGFLFFILAACGFMVWAVKEAIAHWVSLLLT